jgi:ABC-type uncharacterized transport system fused permease/ATPase subunit
MPVVVTFRDEISKELLFVALFMVIIFSWVLIDLWCKWLNTFTYETLGLDEKSSWHTFMIAFIVTLIIVTIIIYLRTFGVDYRRGVVGDCDTYGIYANDVVRDCGEYDPWACWSPDQRIVPVTPIGATTMFSLI